MSDIEDQLIFRKIHASVKSHGKFDHAKIGGQTGKSCHCPHIIARKQIRSQGDDCDGQSLMRKAREYLPYRLEFWASKYGYSYSGIRLSHANTRWGSRSSSGTISLNIGLMKVPEPLRDYVILHELAHINHMDHSAEFWAEVGAHDPLYKRHRQQLQKFSPGV